MSNTIRFRKINEIEKQIIFTSLSNISTELSQMMENLRHFLYISLESSISKNKFPNVFMISKDQYKILRSLNKDKITSAGLYFGFIKKGDFYLSLEGTEFLYKNNIFSDLKRLHVTDKGEKSILYGNNILKNMIPIITSSLKQNDLLMIFNRNDEIIALAQSKFNYLDTKGAKLNDIIAINLTDKGYYLRVSQ